MGHSLHMQVLLYMCSGLMCIIFSLSREGTIWKWPRVCWSTCSADPSGGVGNSNVLLTCLSVLGFSGVWVPSEYCAVFSKPTLFLSLPLLLKLWFGSLRMVRGCLLGLVRLSSPDVALMLAWACVRSPMSTISSALWSVFPGEPN